MTERMVEAPLTEFLHRKAVVAGAPLSGTFELTPCCNMSCRMCYVRLTEQQQKAIRPLRSAEEWIELGQKAKEHGMLYLLLTGGEPFLRPDIRQILTGLHRLGLVISINSNGTLIDESTVDWLKETPPVRINMTLYGASDKTYERLCGNPEGFTQVVSAIHLLKRMGINVKLNCSVTPYNIGDLEEIFAFARREDLVIQATSYMFPPLRRDISRIGINDRFCAEDAAYCAARIECLMNGEENLLHRVESGLAHQIPKDTDEICADLAEGEDIRCRAGRCSFWVTWEGTMLPCGMFPMENMSNVFEREFSLAWQEVRSAASMVRLPKKCAVCAMKNDCRPCAAMAYTEGGDFSVVPEYRCRMTNSYYAACYRMAKKIREERRMEV